MAMTASPPDSWQRLLETTLGVPFTEHNTVEPLRNGTEIFPAMLDAIERAESSVDFLTFVYWTGDVANRFADTLAAAARRGVATRVLLDAFGAKRMDSSLVERMRSAGVRVGWFRPLQWWRPVWSTHRTHRKVLIVDGRVGFTGGVGIAEEWEGDGDEPGSWRETHFRLRGPVVDGLAAAFLGNWLETDEAGPAMRRPTITHAATGGAARIQVVRSAGSFGWSDAATCFRTVLERARERVRIATPYFIPDAACSELLRQAAARDVRVEILVPGPYIDERLARIGARDHFEPLVTAGIEIRLFQPTMIHAKIITVDRTLACIGSANFNHRSMRKDDEILLHALDEALVKALDDDFDADLARADRVDLDRCKRRGPTKRLLEWATRPLQREM